MTFDNFRKKFELEPVREVGHGEGAKPLVSVCVHTYQHVNYIRSCLDSILMQVTDFSFEVLVGDDCSTDGTREICEDYAQRYPDKIRLFLHQRENNIHLNGKPSGRFNFMYNLYQARGQYIAICEGDDYWSNPAKLQMQISFLKAHDECSLVFHKVSKLIDDKIVPLNFPDIGEVIGVDDFILRGSVRIHTSTITFRRRALTITEEFASTAVGDKYVILNVGAKGAFGYIPEYMSVYRIHAMGSWSPNETDVNYMSHYLIGYFALLKLFNTWSGNKYNDAVRKRMDWDAYRHLKRYRGTSSFQTIYFTFKDFLSLKSRLKLAYFKHFVA